MLNVLTEISAYQVSPCSKTPALSCRILTYVGTLSILYKIPRHPPDSVVQAQAATLWRGTHICPSRPSSASTPARPPRRTQVPLGLEAAALEVWSPDPHGASPLSKTTEPTRLHKHETKSMNDIKAGHEEATTASHCRLHSSSHSQLNQQHIHYSLHYFYPFNMRASFFTAFVLAATLVSGAPLDTRGNNSPTFGKGGNAQSGHSGNVNGGDVANQGGLIFNGAFASKFSSIMFFLSHLNLHVFRLWR